ncbi:hypothetical protein AUEXF2481DRAFT_31497 [Aureobasidium subglaciale EXF-2481]|uniref:Aminoglycoside phosphotransferase domain-containing protein n=1 Tax=Aureobasidium subglaciale (strain EXF-2481) TaxID=1043005 RepID=A0A074Y5G5_AURSE|nr:uncharacterized protein AUEXF2481DRAFT_31497 [Aureobasidium subglaciale EXF-2481]KAI5195637.1 hypothetical protein E4T38_08937 [Aureobasidium subglaciale]KAI5214623.1 hypothetical protein E4T40_08917 [Aureobasidium subglaciale]KAI5217409.1 hypothetical protein E4T41_08876 [Aureobasidium subglaciale]KAI5255045.1 hypothetical protein E4T46_08910 [Aureobasidium subglaciale]KEQ93038.1 hypothetical protein AUEXF2481DRAFT_31497 [Aureobasidium subglaciale EXF-2481]
MNHVNYQQRLDFVKKLLQERFALKVHNIEPIEYDADCPFEYNNFIYKVQIDCQECQWLHAQSGTSPLNSDTSQIIMRLSNAASGMPDHNRVENEVGMMFLFRRALANRDLGHLVPQVHAWGSAEGGQGWILEEFVQGSQLDRVFETASGDLKQSVLDQMADIVAAMQSFAVPHTITQYGGVSFSPTGDVISGPMTTLSEGPFQTRACLYQTFLTQQLSSADRSPVLQGWRDDGLRARLERFCADELPELALTSENSNKTIVHSDFTMNNVLIDESTGKLVALLDFDWSYIGSAHDEFLRSFCDLGMIPGPQSEGHELDLRQELLSGQSDQFRSKETANALQNWYQVLKSRGSKVPSDLTGMEEISRLHWFINQISPWLLTHPVPLKRRSKVQLGTVRESTRQSILAFLQHTADPSSGVATP